MTTNMGAYFLFFGIESKISKGALSLFTHVTNRKERGDKGNNKTILPFLTLF
jgi:hypothetical protein